MNRAKIVAKELSLPDVGLTNGVESCRMTGSIWKVNHRIIWYGMSTLLIEERSGEKSGDLQGFSWAGWRPASLWLAIVHCARVPRAPQCHDASMLRGAPAPSPKHLLRPPPLPACMSWITFKQDPVGVWYSRARERPPLVPNVMKWWSPTLPPLYLIHDTTT